MRDAASGELSALLIELIDHLEDRSRSLEMLNEMFSLADENKEPNSCRG
jgi:hypothetical protein